MLFRGVAAGHNGSTVVLSPPDVEARVPLGQAACTVLLADLPRVLWMLRWYTDQVERVIPSMLNRVCPLLRPPATFVLHITQPCGGLAMKARKVASPFPKTS